MFQILKRLAAKCNHRIFNQGSRRLAYKVFGCSIGISSTYFILNKMNKFDIEKSFVSKCDDLLLNVPYVIVGNGTAAFYAAKTILANDQNAKIVLISSQEYPYSFDSTDRSAFCRSEIRKAIKDDKEMIPISLSFPILDNIVAVNELSESKAPSVSIFINTHVESIDLDSKVLKIDGGDKIGFGKVIIANELHPKPHKIFDNVPNEIKNRVIFMNELKSYQEMIEILKHGAKSIAVVGSTPSAYSLACALSSLNKDKFPFYYINEENEPSFMNILPETHKGLLVNHLIKRIKNLSLGVEIDKIIKNDERIEIIMKNNKSILADYVIVFNETEPDSSFYEGVKCQGKSCPDRLSYINGGYEVDEKLQSLKNKNLFIAGDNAIYSDPILKINHFCPGFIHSFYTSHTAGRNITGLSELYDYLPVQNFNLADKIKYIAVGLTDPQLETTTCIASPTDFTPSVYKKAVIFYHKDDKIVGVVSWNLFRNISICEEIIKNGYNISDVNEICKFFLPHSKVNCENNDKTS